jgi:Ankyrin repeats (3 copies)/Ankyrin repeats (many copies)/Ankyrin repeat
MGFFGGLLKGSGTIKGVVTFRTRPPGFEWMVLVGFREAAPGSKPVPSKSHPFDGVQDKHVGRVVTLETDRFELTLPAGHYHVIVSLTALELVEPNRIEADPRTQFQWPVGTTVEVVKGQVKHLNLKVDAFNPDQPIPEPTPGAPAPAAQAVARPQPAGASESLCLITWLPDGKLFARPDGGQMPKITPPSEEVVAALGRAERLERAGKHPEALAAWQEAESAIESMRSAGHLLLRASLGRARALLALGRASEAMEALQIHLSPGRCLRWLPIPMGIQFLTALGEAAGEDLMQMERACNLALLLSTQLAGAAPEHEHISRLREALVRKLAAKSTEKALEVIERQSMAWEGTTQRPDAYGLHCRVVLLRKLGREPAALWLVTQALQQLGASHPRHASFEKLRAQFPPQPISQRPEEELFSPASIKRIKEGELGKKLLELVQQDNLPELRRMHAAGASMDAPQAGMVTPLMGAANLGRLEIVRFLLSVGVDLHAKDHDGRTALMHAADENRGAVIRVLIERGAEVNGLDGALQTALHLASWQNHVDAMRELLRAGARVDVRDCTQRTPLMLAATEDVPEAITLLCEAGADVEAQDFMGNTALMVAAMEGRSRTVQALLARGARASATNRDGLTAFDWAQQYQHQDTARLLRLTG